MPRTKNMRKRGPPLEDELEEPPHTDMTQNTPDDEERPAAAPRPETRSTGTKLSIKLKQRPPPPPKDNEAGEPEPEPTRAAPSSSADTVKIAKKKNQTATGGKKSKGTSEASSSKQTIIPPPNTTPPARTPTFERIPSISALEGIGKYADETLENTPQQISPDSHSASPGLSALFMDTQQRERVIQAATEERQGKGGDPEGDQIEETIPALTKDPETPAPRASIGTTKEKAIPAVPLKKRKESDVLYLGWTRVEELDMDVKKTVSPLSAAAPAMSDVTAPAPGELQVEAKEVLMELQERQAKAAKNLILAIFEGNKPDRQAALEGLEDGFKEAGVSFRGRPVTFLGRNCYSVEVSTEKNRRALVLKQRVTRPTHELFFYKFPPGFSPSQKDLVHRPTMELDLLVEDLCETDNTPVFLAMMVEGFAQYLGKRATREESGDQLIHVLYTGKAPIPNKIRIMGKVHPIHIQESRTTPPAAATPSKPTQDRGKRRRSPSAQGGTSRRQSDRVSMRREETPTDGQASPERTRDQWGGQHTVQRSPSPERARVERSPSEDPVPRGRASSSRRFKRLKVNLWLHVSNTRPRKYLALWSGPPVRYVTPTFHMVRDQLPENGVHSFLEASEEHRMQEHQTIFKFSQGEHFWNPAVGRRGGTLIIAKGPWQSLATSHQILIPGRAHMIGIKVNARTIGLLNIYAPASRSTSRAHFFRVLQRRLPTGIDDWILAGDFNFVDHEEDKQGGIIQDRRTRAERLAWNSFLLQIGTCDAYEIPGFVIHEPRFTWRERQRRGIQRRLDRFYLTMDLCMQGGKLDIDNTYTDFSDHRPIRLTLPFRRSRGPRKPIAIPKKFFEEQANNNRAHEQWEKHKGNLHSFTLQIAQEARAKIRKDRRGVFNTVQKVRSVLASINTDLRSNPDDPWLQAQKIQVKRQLERIEADKMEAFLKAGHIRWHASELALNREFYRSIRSKVVSPPMFGLKDEQGQLHTEIDDMHNMAAHYYSQLFKEEPWDEARQEKLERELFDALRGCTLAEIWKARCARLFQDTDPSARATISKVWSRLIVSLAARLDTLIKRGEEGKIAKEKKLWPFFRGRSEAGEEEWTWKPPIWIWQHMFRNESTCTSPSRQSSTSGTSEACSSDITDSSTSSTSSPSSHPP
ncbi:hypothetical protein SELMODRAFT_431488 [Selaginella moellendorffii]|uniref:Endonuclease/exonuclease/phosphatase domain-containing protein n=1 Tax=Selaginella moellendorffii TaxID=88036 RepID=D8TCT8_SELML|nr:hypothetical protein SELMODRAFT_431488 [Selaginella moellendorffii]